MTRVGFLAGILLVFSCCNAAAQSNTPPTPPELKLLSGVTVESFLSMVQAMGFPCTRGTDADGKPGAYFSFSAEGHIVQARVLTDGLVYLSCRYTNNRKITMEKLNDWNSHEALATAYLERANPQDEGEIGIGTPITVSNGVTPEHVQSMVTAFAETVTRFLRFLNQKPVK
jgi:hypothetical protein